MPEIIHINGTKDLSKKENEFANELTLKYYKKLSKIREIKNSGIASLDVNVKEYKTQGRAKKFSIKVSLFLGNNKIESNYSSWNFAKTLQESFARLMEEIEHKLKISENNR
ncbi:MAG: hypothetical protein ACOYT4_02375 [Nanoarchaeota archaeon]